MTTRAATTRAPTCPAPMNSVAPEWGTSRTVAAPPRVAGRLTRRRTPSSPPPRWSRRRWWCRVGSSAVRWPGRCPAPTRATLGDVLAANNASISSGVGADVVGAVAIVRATSSVPGGVAGGVELGAGFGGSNVLSVPSESPPVVSTSTRMAMTTNVAAPATQMIERGLVPPHSGRFLVAPVDLGRLVVIVADWRNHRRPRPLTVVALAHDLNLGDRQPWPSINWQIGRRMPGVCGNLPARPIAGGTPAA